MLPTDPTRKNAEFLGWFTEATGGTQVTANDVFTETADKTYYAHWEITEVFSVTVPVTLPLVVDESGEVHTGSSRDHQRFYRRSCRVLVSAFQPRTAGSSFRLHDRYGARQSRCKTAWFQDQRFCRPTKTGDTETFVSDLHRGILRRTASCLLSYDAVVSAVSKAVTEQEVLSIVFVLEWGGE